MMPRTLLSLLLGVLLGCSPDSTAPTSESPGDPIRAIHIARDGIPVDSVIRTGALGSMSFELLVEGRDGSLRPAGDMRTTWGSTHPSIVDEAFHTGNEVFVFRHQNGRARIVAEAGPFRDTVTMDVHQVAIAVRLGADTLVTLMPGARDVTGAPTAYHTFRFGAERVDSNGFVVPSSARIDYTPVAEAPFDVFPGARGDTVSIAGRAIGSGGLVVQFAGRADTIPVQVAGAYRVLRLTETSSRIPRPLPAMVTIPRGTAIIVRNETSFVADIGASMGAVRWRLGRIPTGGIEAQLFTTPGEFEVYWAGERCLITVMP